MPQEIERKFLVTDTSYRELATSSSHIVQGYICSDKGRTVRIRIRNDKGYLTIKGGSNAAGLSRYEWEQEIDVADAHDLLKLCEPGIIDKVRYLVPSGNHVFEVDEFAGKNQGLVIAEVELAAKDEPYTKPAFIGQEVTGNRRYYNSHLRVYPYSIWKNE
ncbi:MAG: CYTH domain-containing protein [Bacteroidaceae bacterium]|nr:CYTH domain-containing protein [Bacteroidaceae bacterium]